MAERVLLVIDEPLRGEELRERLAKELGTDPVQLFVVSPALADSALHHHMGEIDDAIPPARDRLEESLENLREMGIGAVGEVGDSDPLIAISDEVQKVGPDRVLVIASPAKRQAYMEDDLLGRAERDLDIPVKELVLEDDGDGGDPGVASVAETDPVAERKKGPRATRDSPPLTRRDIAGLVIAVVGTVIVGALAAGTASHDNSAWLEEGKLDAFGAIALLTALAVALVNAAHIVGLLLFQSVRYTGTFEKFFARASITATVAGLIVTLGLYLVS